MVLKCHDGVKSYGNVKGCVCVFIPSPVREGSTLFGDHRGSILSKIVETSQEG